MKLSIQNPMKIMTLALGMSLLIQPSLSSAEMTPPGGPGAQQQPGRNVQQGPQQGGFDRGGDRGPDRGPRPGGPDRGPDRGPGPGGPGRGPDRGPGPGGPGRFRIDPQTASQIVGVLYQALLFRPADPSGFNSYMGLIRDGGFDSIRDAANSMLNSPEFRQNVWRRYNAPQIVTNLYTQLLGRAPDHGGFQNAIQHIQSGDIQGVVDGMLTSPEFRQRYGL